MRWEIAPKVRCDIHTYTGINCAGLRKTTNIHPLGGLQGDKLDDANFQSMIIVAPKGTRITLISTVNEDDWEQRSWRAIEIHKDKAFVTKEGKLAVRIPHLDNLDAPNARRTDPDFQASYTQVTGLEDGNEWTYGRSAATQLCNNVRAIKIDKKRR